MNIKKEDFIKLEKAINLLEDINKNIITTSDMDNIIAEASNVISELNDKYNKEKKRVKPFVLDKKHVDYLNSVRAELIEAEEIIDNIKKSKEWKRTYDYFSNMCTKGKLKVRPTKDNGYTYELSDNYYNHNKPLSQKYVDHLINTRAELIKAEEIVSRIKNTDEWKNNQRYFNLCSSRGLLESRPSKENGYTVKAKEF